MSGSECDDIDECAHEPSPCQFICQNVVGSFTCLCPQVLV